MKAATTPSPSQQTQEPALGVDANTAHVMNLEIELQWTLDALPNISGLQRVQINQGYLVIDKNGDEVRLRQKGDSLVQTVKKGSGLTRTEIETTLTQQQFDILWPATAGKRIEKTRFQIPHGDVMIEMDVYGGSLRGLIVAEVEFSSIEAAESFIPPEWFREEITHDKSFKNQSLARYGNPWSAK